LAGGLTLPIVDVALDSRKIGRGDAFIALHGPRRNTREHIVQAVERGAAVVLVEAGEQPGDIGVPVLPIEGLKLQLGGLAKQFYGAASANLRVIGVTGTNGKTSVSYMLAELLAALGERCGIIGTLGWGFADAPEDTGMTTPDVLTVHRILARLGAAGASYVAMEVSSHGLDQGRVDDVDFTAALFTNLTRDHLDYHGDMAAYGASKRKLFLRPLELAVCNLDDAFGNQLYRDTAVDCARLSYSVTNSAADVYCRELRYHDAGASALLVTPWGEAALDTALLGPFNLLNLVASITLLGGLGFALPELASAASACRGAPGRMELVHAGEVRAIVDYAHTPDALEQLLRALRPHVAGNLHLVFGCGGDRDRGKRPLMGAIAGQLADRVVLTSDNPRSEPAEQIIEDIREGMTGDSTAMLESDRRAAINLALAAAAPGDLVVIAGKGHETYQQIGQQRLPFSDRESVEQYFSAQQAGQ
jgi:UDP-N-acetylmuramoyl-L-alanyl-D-glutamate--2,6-diaminopimelate ligase